ncbi:hypothetical protein HPG69_007956 [Diceros bicornis minor]|uniref:Phospholipid scramblase n=1 Tax=Diceros bicornis minor TaxID=77932 RepID=A0A7J7EFI0_DICBM|nr:hypothetical protein HPG69_007956 [Diceros bicornis minor]
MPRKVKRAYKRTVCGLASFGGETETEIGRKWKRKGAVKKDKLDPPRLRSAHGSREEQEVLRRCQPVRTSQCVAALDQRLAGPPRGAGGGASGARGDRVGEPACARRSQETKPRAAGFARGRSEAPFPAHFGEGPVPSLPGAQGRSAAARRPGSRAWFAQGGAERQPQVRGLRSRSPPAGGGAGPARLPWRGRGGRLGSGGLEGRRVVFALGLGVEGADWGPSGLGERPCKWSRDSSWGPSWADGTTSQSQDLSNDKVLLAYFKDDAVGGVIKGAAKTGEGLRGAGLIILNFFKSWTNKMATEMFLSHRSMCQKQIYQLGISLNIPQQHSKCFIKRPPGNTGYPGPQAGYPGPQAGYPGPQAGFPGPQAGYSVPPADYPGAGPGGFAAHQQPVYNQPGRPAGIPWMPTPPPPSNCPPGLEYLSQIDQILIHQQIELLEVLTGFETNNKYEIKNSFGQRIYFAKEDTDCCTRYCCGASRPFNLKILDNIGQEVITMQRPLRCSSCCFPCCLQEVSEQLEGDFLEVHAPPGVPIGYVTQIWHPCLPKFTVQNERREDVLKIIGPCLVCSCCADIDFEVKSLDEQNVVGKITKQWGGFVREAYTDADNFGIQFPLDLDVKVKATMLGACFLIVLFKRVPFNPSSEIPFSPESLDSQDFMFFETSGRNE